ncbi:unnamed protein product [Ectocarpus sp. 12 AP-2014]
MVLAKPVVNDGRVTRLQWTRCPRYPTTVYHVLFGSSLRSSPSSQTPRTTLFDKTAAWSNQLDAPSPSRRNNDTIIRAVLAALLPARISAQERMVNSGIRPASGQLSGASRPGGKHLPLCGRCALPTKCNVESFGRGRQASVLCVRTCCHQVSTNEATMSRGRP